MSGVSSAMIMLIKYRHFWDNIVHNCTLDNPPLVNCTQFSTRVHVLCLVPKADKWRIQTQNNSSKLSFYFEVRLKLDFTYKDIITSENIQHVNYIEGKKKNRWTFIHKLLHKTHHHYQIQSTYMYNFFGLHFGNGTKMTIESNVCAY